MGGGHGSHINAPGGYSGGWKNLSKDQILYVVCGGKGIDDGNYDDGTSYNGGGSAYETGGYYGVFKAGGGGATHISTATGLLKDLVENKSAVICVAGGAGSNGAASKFDFTKYESGGGLVGLGSNNGLVNDSYLGDTGGTQEGCGPDGIKGGFGYGGNGTNYGGCGGGGWYGGNGTGGDNFADRSLCGGGGSGYIGGLTNATSIDGGKTFPKLGGGTEQGHFDNGCALISWISPSL